MKKLRLECVDLLYVHWPAFAYKAGPTLNAISILIDEGKVRNIGISNFTPQLVEEAVTACNKPIFALQAGTSSVSPSNRIIESLWTKRDQIYCIFSFRAWFVNGRSGIRSNCEKT